MVPVPPTAPPQAPHSGGGGTSHATSHAWARAILVPPPELLPARLAKLVRNSCAPCTRALPKPAYCSPLIMFSTRGPIVELSPEIAFSTVLKSPVADALAASSAPATAY